MKKVIIMGAAGRDFHNFNCVYRNNPNHRVVAFTATQIPYISKRTYPSALAGRLYPKGIPIFPEETLEYLIKKFDADEVIFAYSDVPHEYVMHKASLAIAAGADFKLVGPKQTMLKSKVPVVSVCATRTGAGKSPTSRAVSNILRDMGYKVVIVRHPMPYGDLSKQILQRFETAKDLDRHKCTIEEREEYEPHIANGFVVYAGVDYEKILRKAEKEADIILWDGGNNDLPFVKPDMHIVVTDARRPGHELAYHPGETNLRLADIVIVNKVNRARPKDINTILKNIRSANSRAKIVFSNLILETEDTYPIRNRRVLAVEDGPTLTHGSLPTGAAWFAAKEAGAKIVDPRPYAKGSIKDVFRKFPHLNHVLPAMGYSKKQIKELESTINSTPCDAVLTGTPTDLRHLMKIKRPVLRVKYETDNVAKSKLEKLLKHFTSG